MCSKEDLQATEDTIRQWLIVENGRVVVRDGCPGWITRMIEDCRGLDKAGRQVKINAAVKHQCERNQVCERAMRDAWDRG